VHKSFLAQSILLFAVAAASLSAQAQTESTIYTFTGGDDGGGPFASLVQGIDGNFYGTASYDGSAASGTIFKLSPSGNFTLLYTFTGGDDGAYPQPALTQGPDGDFYGTTDSGGSTYSGTIFKITPSGTFTLLGPGANLVSQLVLGQDGNFYATAISSGIYGTVLQITPAGSVNVIYRFTGQSDGSYPSAPLVQGSDGNFYGTTTAGASQGTCGGEEYGCGTVFSVSPSGTFTTLYTFGTPAETGIPHGALVQGWDGNFYGTTFNGGTSGGGTAFKMAPAGGSITTLYNFSQQSGGQPMAGVVQGSDGNFYGTTEFYGTPTGAGTLYELTPSGGFTKLYDFTGNADGATPFAPLLQGADGNFYGTATGGGAAAQNNGFGTVFEEALSPTLAPPVQLTLSQSSVAAGTPVTFSFKVLNAYSMTMQQCYAFQTLNGGVTAFGKLHGTYNSTTNLFSGSATLTPTTAGSYNYALTCGGTETGLATLTVTGASKSSSTTALAANPASPTIGQSVTLTATITGSGATPTGTVTFSYGSDVLHTATLNAGAATFTASTNGLPAGTYNITAKYSGDTNYKTSSATDSVKLAAAPTATSLIASPASVTPPASVTLTATVVRSATGTAGTPTGSVTFYADGSHALATVKLNSSGVATVTASSNGYAAAAYPITAKYLGDASDTSSTSSAVNVTVQ